MHIHIYIYIYIHICIERERYSSNYYNMGVVNISYTLPSTPTDPRTSRRQRSASGISLEPPPLEGFSRDISSGNERLRG